MKTRDPATIEIMSRYVKDLRGSMGLSQQAFGSLIGKSRDAVTNYENGRAIPPGDVLLKMQKLKKRPPRFNAPRRKPTTLEGGPS